TKRAARGEPSAANPVGDPLFEALRATRRELAAEAGVPPYVVFHDAALRAMASERPATRAELARIPGVGAREPDAWGDGCLAVIRGFGRQQAVKGADAAPAMTASRLAANVAVLYIAGMSDFRPLSPGYSVAPQIALEDIAEAKAAGFAVIINNRPDGE